MVARAAEKASLRCVEFFAGIGGLHAAADVARAPIEVVRAFEISDQCRKAYRANFSTVCDHKTIERLSVDEVSCFDAQVWLLSPPCQPFTRSGKYQDSQDPRTLPFLKLIGIFGAMQNPPKYLFIENVLGFEKSETRKILIEIPWRFEDSDAFLDCLEKLKGFSRSSAEFHRVLNKIDAVLTRGVGVGQLYTLMKRFGRLNSQEGVELVWRHLEPRVGELGEQARVNVLWSVATSRKPPTSVPPVLAEVDHAALDPLHLYRLLMGCSRMNIKIPWKRVSPAIVAMLKNPECKTFYLPRIFTSIVQTAPADLTDAVMRAIRQQLEDLEYRDLEEIFQAMARHYQHPDMLHEVEERMLIFQKRGAAPSGSTA
eukprot:GEMP01049418.1.p1 GENE.GEMP01049418.1~~GEMP01049418.1.p1  ORF type:complete len:370 (+),score=75.87 GEMP01049418.1:114-1223(+)